MTDEELVLLAKSSDKLAEQAVYERFMSLVRIKARPYFLVGADKADLVQEGAIGLFNAIRDFDPERQVNFRSFAELCITRQIFSAIKSATRQKHIPLNTYVSLDKPVYDDDEQSASFGDTIAGSAEENPEELIVNREAAEAMQKAIRDSLTELECSVLELFIDGKSYVEIACAIGKSPKTVDNALQRIKRKTVKLIERSGE